MPDGRLEEVISVVARRRRWTLEQKLALVEEVSRPGSSVAAVADRHGVSRSLLFEWRRQIRETEESVAEASDGDREVGTDGELAHQAGPCGSGRTSGTFELGKHPARGLEKPGARRGRPNA